MSPESLEGIPAAKLRELLVGAELTLTAMVRRLGGSVTLTQAEIGEARKFDVDASGGSSTSRTWRVVRRNP